MIFSLKQIHMSTSFRLLYKFTLTFFLSIGILFPLWSQVISISDSASFQEKLSAKEVRKYIYLRTGKLLEIRDRNTLPPTGDIILVGTFDHPLIRDIDEIKNINLETGATLIKSINHKNRNILVITGKNASATLRSAYRFAEHLGVGFDLAGDIIPDERIPLDITGFDEVGEPRFDIMGILPFHDFHQGPDLWNTEDYRSVISQLPKMGMNFIGLHNYHRWSGTADKENNIPQGPEPNVWIGLPEDVNENGMVKWSYPAFLAHTHRPDRIWGFAMLNTNQFHAGASQLFAQNGYRSDVMGVSYPTDVASSNVVFNRSGKLLNIAFSHARQLSVKTAVGTELPMGLEPSGPEVDYDWVRGIPPLLQQRLNAMNMSPADPETIKAVYKGIFERIIKTHPLDYYWLWSWEVWSNYGVSRKQIDAFESDIKIAKEALEELGNPFQLGLAGWRVGTIDNHAEFDDLLPSEAPFYGLWDEAEGMEYLKESRLKWAATWAEEDWGLFQPQLELHRIYNDAEAAINKETNGMIAKHWRTRILGANLMGMKELLWTYRPSAQKKPDFPSNKKAWIHHFYQDWAELQFGTHVGADIGAILAELDNAGEPGEPGAIPIVSDWDSDMDNDNGAPGAISMVENSWEKEKEKYSFINDLELLRTKVKGISNQERFDYWLNALKITRLMAEYGTLRYQFEQNMEAENWSNALTLRIDMASLFEEIMTLEIEKMVNVSDLGEIINLEILNWYQLMQLKWDKKLVAGLGKELPESADPDFEYQGKPSIKSTPEINNIYTGEDLELKVWIMGDLSEPTIHWRNLGEIQFAKKPVTHQGRSVFRAFIEKPKQDFEYYLTAKNQMGETIRFPTSDQNRVVLVLEN